MSIPNFFAGATKSRYPKVHYAKSNIRIEFVEELHSIDQSQPNSAMRSALQLAAEILKESSGVFIRERAQEEPVQVLGSSHDPHMQRTIRTLATLDAYRDILNSTSGVLDLPSVVVGMSQGEDSRFQPAFESFAGIHRMVADVHYYLAFSSRESHRHSYSQSEFQVLELLIDWLIELCVSSSPYGELVDLDLQDHLPNILSHMSAGIVITDHQGLILYTNESFRELTGFTAPQLTGMRFMHLLATRDSQQREKMYEKSRAATESGETVSCDFEILGIQNKVIPISVVSAPMKVHGSDSDFRILTVTDLTQAQEQVLRNESRIALITHELRTPLTSLRGALDLIGTQFPEGIPDSVEMLSKIARRNSDQLSRLLDDLLNAARINHGSEEFNFDKYSIYDLMQESLENHRGFAHTFEVSLSLATDLQDAEVYVDRDKFHQVMSNLFSNAIKYSHRGGTVEFSATVLEEFVEFHVADSGQGIPDEFIGKIFDEFVRVPEKQGLRIKGTGLGLAITRQITEAMGGYTKVDSMLGQGSTFTIGFGRWSQLPCSGLETVVIDIPETGEHEV